MNQRFLYGLLLLGLLFACDEPTHRMEGYAVHGIDVSHYQKQIDWPRIAEQDIHFAFVKATEGLTYQDSLFCRNWDGMAAAQIKRGAYHFFRPSVSAYDQARNYMHWVNMEAGDLAPVLDVEVLDGVSKVTLIAQMHTWLYLVEINYGIKPVIYTNLKFYNRYLAGHFKDYPLWIARYNTRTPTLACGREWDFWQYGSKGRLEGIEGNIDFNVFRGSPEALEQYCVQPTVVLSDDQHLASIPHNYR